MSATKPATEQFNWVNIFDGGEGCHGAYIWYELPHAMTRGQARDFCTDHDLCPPERFSAGEPDGINLRRQPKPAV